MLRHYLGHCNMQDTTRYTRMAWNRLKEFWQVDTKNGARASTRSSKIGSRSHVGIIKAA